MNDIFSAFAAHVICENIMPLSEVADVTDGGKHYPLMLITLQNINKNLGKQALTNLFNTSSVRDERAQNVNRVYFFIFV